MQIPIFDMCCHPIFWVKTLNLNFGYSLGLNLFQDFELVRNP